MWMGGFLAMRAVVLGSGTALVLVTRVANAQMPLPAAKPPDGATLFKQQCAVCHTLSLSEPMRQGPPLPPRRQGRSFQILRGAVESRLRLGRWQARRLAGQSAGRRS